MFTITGAVCRHERGGGGRGGWNPQVLSLMSYTLRYIDFTEVGFIQKVHRHKHRVDFGNPGGGGYDKVV